MSRPQHKVEVILFATNSFGTERINYFSKMREGDENRLCISQRIIHPKTFKLTTELKLEFGLQNTNKNKQLTYNNITIKCKLKQSKV